MWTPDREADPVWPEPATPTHSTGIKKYINKIASSTNEKYTGTKDLRVEKKMFVQMPCDTESNMKHEEWGESAKGMMMVVAVVVAVVDIQVPSSL